MRLLAFRHSDIYLHFHHATQSSEITERDWKHLSEAINSTFPNFLRQLYALYPQLSEHELHICYLIKIELKRSIIAELLNRSVSAITNSLSRLYQKSIARRNGTTNGRNYPRIVTTHMEKFICQWVKLVFSQECTSIYYLYISLLYKSIEKVKCIFHFFSPIAIPLLS